MVFQDPNRLKDILYNKSIREQYDKISSANNVEGDCSVSDQLSAEHEFNQFEIDDDMRFIGICDARRGPNTKSNHYHLHILTGTTENDVYITNQSSGDCWNFINDRFQKYMNNAVIYVEFKVVVEQLQNNKHCVIVPTDVVEICRSCFRTDVNFSDKYASFCTSCQDKMFSSGVNGYLRHICAVFPFLLLDENEKTVKIKLQKRNSGRLGEIIAALEEIRRSL